MVSISKEPLNRLQSFVVSCDSPNLGGIQAKLTGIEFTDEVY